MEQRIDQIVDIWVSGGWVMVPLVLLAVILYATGMQLILYLRKGSLDMGREAHWIEAIRDPSKGEGRIGEIIRYTQEDVSSDKQVRGRFEEVRQAIMAGVDGRLRFLNMLIAAAPLLGLLGTVIGMLATFDGLAAGAGAETVDVVAEGISEALITTQTGLFIALPGLFIALVAKRRKHAAEATIARLESLTLTHLNLG